MPSSEDDWSGIFNNPFRISCGNDYFKVIISNLVSQIWIGNLDYDDWMIPSVNFISLDSLVLRRLLVVLVLKVLTGTLTLGGHDDAIDGL